MSSFLVAIILLALVLMMVTPRPPCVLAVTASGAMAASTSFLLVTLASCFMGATLLTCLDSLSTILSVFSALQVVTMSSSFVVLAAVLPSVMASCVRVGHGFRPVISDVEDEVGTLDHATDQGDGTSNQCDSLQLSTMIKVKSSASNRFNNV